MEIPEEYVKELKKIAEGSNGGITYEELEERYAKLFNEDFVQTDETFSDDAERHRFVWGGMSTSYVERPPVSSQNIIPVGVSSVKKNTDNGLKRADLFVLDKSGKLKRVSMQGEICEVLPNIVYYNMYEGVDLMTFDSGDFGADDRTEFGQPKSIGMKPKDLIEKLGIKMVTIKEAPNKLSKTTAKGWAISTDWRAIQARIRSQRHSPDDEESEWGSYNLRDHTVDPLEKPYVNSKKKKVYPGISAWVSPSLMQYEDLSECIFLGPIQKNPKTHVVSMSCFSIIPVHAKYIEE